MDEKSGKSPLVAISAMVALFAAMGVMVYTQVPLRGVRPSIPEVYEPSQRVRARLWEDPFLAVLTQAKSKDRSMPLPAGTCILSQPDKLRQGALQTDIRDYEREGRVTVLGVMVFGGPYAEDMEFRLRQRYAVLSALARLGFIPSDYQHIGFLRVLQNEPQGGKKESQISLSTIMPFEWLVSDSGDASVLLLWINDDALSHPPIFKLASLIRWLRPMGENLKFKVVGPAGSTTLREMLKEFKQGEKLKKAADRGSKSKLNHYAALNNLEIYSATATASASVLLPNVPNEAEEDGDKRIRKEFKAWNIEFNRTICSDEDLSRALMEELKNRDVGPQDHIVLVAEWDTFYGRALPQTFREVREQKDGVGRVYRFSYLRGIDGKLPGDRDRKAEKEAKEDGDRKANGDPQKGEEPQGKGQYDYVRRSAEGIHRLEQQLQRDKEGSIKAIGVLGSDFDDKYLILQALGQRFPDKIFFTTDLDARLLHSANIKWTRNLVVASGFDLQLGKDHQGEVPPFRDCYQTSVFLATLRAFGNLQGEDMKRPPKPRIFEIGRHNAIDLTPRDRGNPLVNEAPPAREEVDGTWLFKLMASLTILAALLLLSCVAVRTHLVKSSRQFFSDTYEWGRRKPTKDKLKLVVGLLGLAGLVLLIAFFHEALRNYPPLSYLKALTGPSEEPFFLTEGVSVWPAEIIRLIAFGCALVFCGIAMVRLKKNRENLTQEFCLGNKEEGHDTWSRLGNQAGSQNMDRLWEDYVRRGALWRRLCRFFFIMILYVGVCYWIIGTFEKPTSPVRGAASILLDKGILICTVAAFLFLTFFVFDATLLCRGFVTLCLGKEPEWSPRSVAAFKGEVGTAKEGLSEWMLIRLIAERTAVVGRLIFYPFIVWFILFLARLHYFDNWRTPMGLVIVISLSALLTWWCAVMLRRSAEKLRTDVVDRLSKKLIQTHWQEPLSTESSERLKYVLDEVKKAHTGAFAPYLQQPMVQALLVPLGGVGGMKLLDFLTNLT
jgi:hypothetical protein